MSLNEVLKRGQRVRLLSVEKGITIGKNENFWVPIMGDQTREWKILTEATYRIDVLTEPEVSNDPGNSDSPPTVPEELINAFISVWNIWIRWFIGFSCSAIVVIIIGDPSAQIFRWTSHLSGNIDKFKNIFVSLNTVVIKYQKLLIYLVSFKYLKHLYHFATMVTGCVAISQRKD